MIEAKLVTTQVAGEAVPVVEVSLPFDGGANTVRIFLTVAQTVELGRALAVVQQQAARKLPNIYASATAGF